MRSLSGNGIGEIGCGRLAAAIAVNTVLEELKCVAVLRRSCTAPLRNWMTSLRAYLPLPCLSLQSNVLGVSGCATLMAALAVNSTLASLECATAWVLDGSAFVAHRAFAHSLRWNDLGNESCDKLAEALAVNAVLQQLECAPPAGQAASFSCIS